MVPLVSWLSVQFHPSSSKLAHSEMCHAPWPGLAPVSSSAVSSLAIEPPVTLYAVASARLDHFIIRSESVGPSAHATLAAR